MKIIGTMEVAENEELSFSHRIPNAETIKAFNEDRSGSKTYSSASEMLNSILSE